MSFVMDNNDLTELECPVCMEHFRIPIYQCANGHSFCSVCTKHMSTCPQCRRPISNTRNYALENLMQRVQVKCEHCAMQLKLNKYTEHVNTCSFNHIACLMANCHDDLHKKNILEHIRLRHASFLVQNNSVLKSHQLTMSCVDIGTNIFWLQRYINAENFMSWFAQAAIPLAKDVSYELTVSILLRNGNRHSLTFPVYKDSMNDLEYMIDDAVVAFDKHKTMGGKFQVRIAKSEMEK